MRSALVIEHNKEVRDPLCQILIHNFELKVDVCLEIPDLDLAQCDKEAETPIVQKLLNCEYSLIFIQNRMPGISGLEFIRRLSRLCKYRNVSLILLADSSFRNLIAEAYDAGVREYIATPLVPKEVIARIRHMLNLLDQTQDLKVQNKILQNALESATTQSRSSEERYRLATSAAMDGIWDWNLEDGSIFYSDTWCEMLGFEKHEVPTIPLFWTNRIHPEYRTEFTKVIDDHIRGKLGYISHETRIRNRTGDYLWVRVKGKVLRDKKNTPVRIVGAQSDISTFRKIQEQLLHNALHDNLTSLPNRTLFNERVSQAYLRFQRYPEEKFAIAFFDLDKFKDVNDVYGHAAGDKLLIYVSKILAESVRQVDTVARLGGDEFVILIEQITDLDEVTQIVERVFKAAETPIQIAGENIHPQFSVGVSISRETHVSADKTVKEADIALYQAKEGGRNQCVVYDPENHSKTPRKLELASSLASALDNKEIFVYYQPIVDTKSNKIWGYEALLRWHHPTLGLVSPIDFIPLAEQNDMIVHLDNFALNTALKQLSIWHRQKIKLLQANASPLKISINVSSSKVLEPNFIDHLTSLKTLYNLRAEDIILEFSEYHLGETLQKNHGILNDIRKKGFYVALDDFGEGRASVRSIVDYPLSVLKLDRSLIAGMDDDPKRKRLFHLIMNLGVESDLITIVKGVQDDQGFNAITEAGGRYIQGFYFSEPRLPDDLDDDATVLGRGKKLTFDNES